MHTTYFGPISWYRALINGATIDDTEFYVKQTTRNHCCIATANGVQKLTVPVSLPTKVGCPIRDVRISDHGNWRHQHWEALCTAYGMSPFFEFYADDLRPFFDNRGASSSNRGASSSNHGASSSNRWPFLYDYNLAITEKILSLLGPIAPVPSSVATVPSASPLGLAPVPEASASGKQETTKPYYQTFHLKHGFIPNLSILDLLFNEGPEAILYI